jgi:hypothetical protein
MCAIKINQSKSLYNNHDINYDDCVTSLSLCVSDTLDMLDNGLDANVYPGHHGNGNRGNQPVLENIVDQVKENN